MPVDPSCTFASLSVSAKNRHVVETIRDALKGVFAWPVFVCARDPDLARQLIHATANHVRGELARTEHVLSTSYVRHMTPSTQHAEGVEVLLRRSLTIGDVLIVDGVDERPLTADTIIRLAQAMDTMHTAKRPIVTIASHANDSADGLLAQLTTRYAGGRPLEWHCSRARREGKAA